MFDGLTSESPETRLAASAEILDHRALTLQAIASNVEKYLPDDERPATAGDNIALLGKLRASDYVPLLVQNLTFEVFYKATKRPQTTEDLYPAVQALIDIGSPAVGPVLERLKQESEEVVQKTALAVLRGVLGPDWAGAILDREIRVATSSGAKERLRQAMTLMQA